MVGLCQHQKEADQRGSYALGQTDLEVFLEDGLGGGKLGKKPVAINRERPPTYIPEGVGGRSYQARRCAWVATGSISWISTHALTDYDGLLQTRTQTHMSNGQALCSHCNQDVLVVAAVAIRNVYEERRLANCGGGRSGPNIFGPGSGGEERRAEEEPPPRNEPLPHARAG